MSETKTVTIVSAAEAKPMSNLDALVRRASRIAELQFKKRGAVTAFWLVEKADGTQEIIVSPIPEGGRAKDEMLAALSEFFRTRGVWRYACALESWVSPDNGRNCRPSDDPEREEIVLILAEDGREFCGGWREIIRSPAGARLGKLEIDPRIERPTGRFLGLLGAARSGAMVQ